MLSPFLLGKAQTGAAVVSSIEEEKDEHICKIT
jgi:hypothetical protein